MLKLDPSERATIPEIFNHCWMRSMSNPHHIDYVSSRSNSISISRDSFEKTEKRSISKEDSNNLLQLDDGMSLSLPLDDGLEISNHVPSPGTLRRSFSAHDKLGFLGSKSVESEVSTPTSPSCKLIPLRRRNSSRIDDDEELLGISDNTTRLRPSTVVEGTRRNSSSLLLNSQKDDIISSSNENGGKRLSTIPTRRPINISVQLKTNIGWSEVNSPNENKAGRERKPSIISNESITPKSSDEINISNKSTIVSPSPVSITSRSGSFISGSSPKIVGRRKF
jgi:hypothetical protein